MRKPGNRYSWLIALFAAVAIIISLSGPALAVDDGARAYWKGKDGTQAVSFQILNLNVLPGATPGGRNAGGVRLVLRSASTLPPTRLKVTDDGRLSSVM